MKKLLVGIGLAAAVLLGVFAFVPGIAERRMNRTLRPPPYTASARAEALAKKLLIVDLHADSLLWSRDLLHRAYRGHVDVPRLIEGSVAVQSFTVVTKTPRAMNFDRNSGDTDNILLLALAEHWPPRTWRSLTQRALYQAEKLHRVASDSGGQFTLIQSASDLRTYLQRRASTPGITAGFLGIEGAHALDADVDNVDVLFNAGFRMMSPSHFFDNEFGGSSAGVEKYGLTPRGREMVRRMEARHMIVDVAHASPATIDDVLAIATRPVVDSHTGAKAACAGLRNLSDDHIRGIAKTGGVIGVAYFDAAVCGTDARAIARPIRYIAGVGGVDHVALGSDFDGAVTTPFDTTGMALIVDALLAEKFTDDEIAKIMGGNALRVLSETLP